MAKDKKKKIGDGKKFIKKDMVDPTGLLESSFSFLRELNFLLPDEKVADAVNKTKEGISVMYLGLTIPYDHISSLTADKAKGYLMAAGDQLKKMLRGQTSETTNSLMKLAVALNAAGLSFEVLKDGTIAVLDDKGRFVIISFYTLTRQNILHGLEVITAVIGASDVVPTISCSKIIDDKGKEGVFLYDEVGTVVDGDSFEDIIIKAAKHSLSQLPEVN